MKLKNIVRTAVAAATLVSVTAFAHPCPSGFHHSNYDGNPLACVQNTASIL